MSVEVCSKMVKEFYPFAKKRLGFNHPPKVKFFDDAENAQDPLGMTAHYQPDSMIITLYTTGRHPKDILRSFSHELVHHAQNCRGNMENKAVGEGYAQNDEELREMEREAYEQGNLIFRDWEDSKKGEGIMEHFKKRNLALNEQLMKKWGLVKESVEIEETEELEESEVTEDENLEENDNE